MISSSANCWVMPDQCPTSARSRNANKSWGSTVIESGHAHLGDVFSDLKIAGGLHVHFHSSRNEMPLELDYHSSGDRRRYLALASIALQQAQQAFDSCVGKGTLNTPWSLSATPAEDLLAASSTHETSSDHPIALFYRESAYLASAMSHGTAWCSEWTTFIWKVLQTIPCVIVHEENLRREFFAAIGTVAAACKEARESSSQAEVQQLGFMLMIFLYDAILWASNSRSGGDDKGNYSKLEYKGFTMILESLHNRHIKHAPRHDASWQSSSAPAFSDRQQLPENHNRLSQEHQLQVMSKIILDLPIQQLLRSNGIGLLNRAESTNHTILGPQLPSLVQIMDSFIDPWQQKELRKLTLGRTRRIRSGQYAPMDASVRRKLQKICEGPSKSFCVLEGSLLQRTMLTDAQVELIHIVQEANIPILYLLNLLSDQDGQLLTALDCLKHFALQLVKANILHHQNDLLSYKLAQCQKSDNIEAWLQVIESAAASLSQVYLAVSLCTVAGYRMGASTSQNSVLMQAIRMFMDIMARLSPTPSIKCIVMSDSQSIRDVTPAFVNALSVEFIVLKLPRKIISGPAKRKLPPLHRKTKLIKLR